MKEVLDNGNVVYRNKDGDWHREDGPAIEWIDGDREWCINHEPIASLVNGEVRIHTKGKLPKLIKQSIAMEVLKVV